MVQQKQRKKPILIDGKNIFTYFSNQYNVCNLILELMV